MDIKNIRKFTFGVAGSNMYIAVKNKEALVVDPHISKEALIFLSECNVSLITVLLTHEHYDHVSGVTWLKSLFNCVIICHTETNLSLQKGKNNRPVVIGARLMQKYPREYIKKIIDKLPQGFVCSADCCFDYEYQFSWNNYSLHCISTPGHSKGSCCIEIDSNIVITGDSLIPNTQVITSFPGGSLYDYINCTVPYLNSIKNGTWILPGHGNVFIKEKNILEENEL